MQNILKNKSLLWSMLGVVVLVIGIIVALQLIPEEQDTRREAAVPGGVAKMMVTPSTVSVEKGQSKSAKLSFTTGGKPINTIAVLMSYTYTGTTPPFEIQSLTKAPQLGEGWSCPLLEASKASNKVTIKIRCSYATAGGFSTTNATQQTDLATFLVQGNDVGEGTLTFDRVETTINQVDEGTADAPTDVLDIPANLAVTVTAGTTPPVEKKITLVASGLTCSTNEFTSTATVTEGTAKKANVAVTFKYNSETKNGTTNADGVATATFTKGTANGNVTAEATGYTTGTAAVNLPTNCGTGGGTDTDKRLLMSYEGLSCTNTNFTVTAEAKEDDQLWRDVLVTFSYDGQQKTATTGTNGKASVTFPSSSTNKNVEATATDFDKGTIEIKRPTDCSTTTTTGTSCNGTCTASRDCKSGLTCVSGRCRDARCSSDTSCGCAEVNVASASGTTTLPESGFDQTATMAILGLIFLLGGSQLLWSYRYHTDTSSDQAH